MVPADSIAAVDAAMETYCFLSIVLRCRLSVLLICFSASQPGTRRKKGEHIERHLLRHEERSKVTILKSYIGQIVDNTAAIKSSSHVLFYESVGIG